MKKELSYPVTPRTCNTNVLSTRHLGNEELLGLAAELVRFGIQKYSISRTLLAPQLHGLDLEKLRNLVLNTSTYIPFARQQSFQVLVKDAEILGDTLRRVRVSPSPVGSIPYILIEIDLQQAEILVQGSADIETSQLGTHLARKFAHTVVEGWILSASHCLSHPNKTIFPVTESVPISNGTRAGA